MNEATHVPCITWEEAIRRQNMLEDSMIALGIDPSDQSKHWTIYYVVETVLQPDGRKVSSYPLSKAFLTKEPAEEAKAALLAEHPGAGVGNFTCVGSPEARALAAQANEEKARHHA